MIRYIVAVLIISAVFACQDMKDEMMDYRPDHHLTPAKNWVNDPNGMVYLDGEYHVFYQYNPFGNKWGHMSWGHSVSKDLITWEHLPVALPEIDNGNGTTDMIFSGSAVVDSANTSGFFEKGFTKGLVAIFTAHTDSSGTGTAQKQGVAYSSDKGRTWKYYDKNPVLDIGMKDFRDPNVVWNKQRNSWLMAVAIPLEFKIQFYESKNLKDWGLLSEFGKKGDTTKIWECPSLFEVPVDGSSETKWALLISSGHKTEGFVGMQYFIGDFDGKTFISQPQNEVFYLDGGKDFYAAIPFNNRPNTEKNPIIMGWTNNWAYAGDIPTVGFRGGFSFPRKLSLYKDDLTLKFRSTPVVSDKIKTVELSEDQQKVKLDKPVFHAKLSDISTPFDILIQQSATEFTKISVENGTLSFDRTKSGNISFNKEFVSIDQMPIGNFSSMDIYMDNSVIEVFVNDGDNVITQQVFPTVNAVSLKLVRK